MSRQRQVIINHPLGSRVNRDEADFGPLAFDAKMNDALSAVQSFTLKPQSSSRRIP
jgi:hypothetical protein